MIKNEDNQFFVFLNECLFKNEFNFKDFKTFIDSKEITLITKSDE